MTRNPFDLATAQGITIEYTDLTALGRVGDANPATRTIRLQSGMQARRERSVLAHEIVHILREDTRTIFGYYNARQERYADEWAAHFLIDINAYREAELQRDGHTTLMAQDLYVTDSLVNAYQRTLHRIGDTVYSQARMGVGQWTHRIEVA